MNRNFIHPSASDALPDLLEALLSVGDEVGSRGGRVKELTHVGITLTDPVVREILVPGRRPNLAAQIAESAWVLAGRNDIDWLSAYLPRAGDFSDDGKTWRGGYGPRLRAWPRRDGEATSVIDQLAHVVDALREDSLTRRAVVSLYDPQVDTAPGKDIPCNNWLSFTSRLGKLDLHVALRSNDAFWGWSGINAFEWSVLQEVVAGLVGIEVGSLHFSTTSFHLYDRHWKRARHIVTETAPGPSMALFQPSPAFAPTRSSLDDFDELLRTWFQVEQNIRDGNVHDSEVDNFPEPMLRSWLRVLRWWWTGDTDHLAPLEGTRLWVATQFSVQPPDRDLPAGAETEDIRAFGSTTSVQTLIIRSSDFIQSTIQLHLEKHDAYGDSWKRRGEMLGILANIARKVDRLQGGETADETSADTAIDLLVYLAKYRTWLSQKGLGAPGNGRSYGREGATFKAPDGTLHTTQPPYSDDPGYANRLLERVEARHSGLLQPSNDELAHAITVLFDGLEKAVKQEKVDRYKIVDTMLDDAYTLASRLWEHERWVAGNATRFWKGYEG